MKIYRGRLIDHIHLRVADLDASRKFYVACLDVLGHELAIDTPQYFSFDELWVDKADDYVSRVHLAFQTPDRDTVDRFHAAAIAAGGKDNGAPGDRAYHPGYYGAFVLDPDGNNIEAVFHGPFSRSADAVEIIPKDMP